MRATAPVVLGFEPEFRVVDPRSILVDHTREGPVDEALLKSVREMGVLAPPLVVEREDATLLLVTGRQRLAAAVEADMMLAVRVLSCSLADAVRAAMAEHYLGRSKRSNFERAWDAYALQEAEIRLGRSGSVRSVARMTSCAVGKAQYLLALGRELTPERVSRLASETGVPTSQILNLTLDTALRLAATPEADRPAVLRQVLAAPASRNPDPTFWLIQAFRGVVEWLLKLLRALLRAARVRGG